MDDSVIGLAYYYHHHCCLLLLLLFGSALDTIVQREILSKSQKMRETRNYTSRVHVADICQALMASMVSQSSSR